MLHFGRDNSVKGFLEEKMASITSPFCEDIFLVEWMRKIYSKLLGFKCDLVADPKI